MISDNTGNEIDYGGKADHSRAGRRKHHEAGAAGWKDRTRR